MALATIAFTSCENKSDVTAVCTDLLKATLHGANTGTSGARGYVKQDGQQLIIAEYEFPSKNVNDPVLLYRTMTFGDGVFEPKKVDTLSYEYGEWQNQGTVFTLLVTPRTGDPFTLKYVGDGFIAPDGRVLGGPFYYIERGLGPKWKPLAVIFAVCGVTAALLGIGTITQINGIVSAVQRFFDPNFDPATATNAVRIFGSAYSPSVIIAGAVVTLCVGLVVIGGLKRIAKVSMVVVPFMAVSYTAICLLVMLGNLDKIPGAILLIIKAAFDPAAVTGGAVGTLFVAMQKGIARGIFSNEAGLGSEPIAAAAAKTNEPARQGFVSMTGTFIDTTVICTMTGLTIVLSGAWDPALKLEGVNVTIEAFSRGFAFIPGAAAIVPFFLMLALAFFAFTTILGWDYYSEKCLEYLVGMHRPYIIKLYRMLYVTVVAIGPYLTVSMVWGISDIFNGLMAFPNLVALIMLSPVVASTTRDFLSRTEG